MLQLQGVTAVSARQVLTSALPQTLASPLPPTLPDCGKVTLNSALSPVKGKPEPYSTELSARPRETYKPELLAQTGTL